MIEHILWTCRENFSGSRDAQEIRNECIWNTPIFSRLIGQTLDTYQLWLNHMRLFCIIFFMNLLYKILYIIKNFTKGARSVLHLIIRKSTRNNNALTNQESIFKKKSSKITPTCEARANYVLDNYSELRDRRNYHHDRMIRRIHVVHNIWIFILNFMNAWPSPIRSHRRK